MDPAILALSIPIVAIGSVTMIVLQRMKNKTPGNAVASSKLDEIAARLERMEQALDAVAVETERISEAQRFTTKLLSERTPARGGP